MTLVYLGISLAAGSLWLYLLLVPILGVIRYGVIGREEAYLDRRFGADYAAYKGSVGRWIGRPRFPRARGNGAP